MRNIEQKRIFASFALKKRIFNVLRPFWLVPLQRALPAILEQLGAETQRIKETFRTIETDIFFSKASSISLSHGNEASGKATGASFYDAPVGFIEPYLYIGSMWEEKRCPDEDRQWKESVEGDAGTIEGRYLPNGRSLFFWKASQRHGDLEC